MAHFAELASDNTVKRVIVVNNSELIDAHGNEQEHLGVSFCVSLFGGSWVQTSYNSSFRKNFAAAGYSYDSTRNAFIPPKPNPSWLLNEETCQWEAPTPMPDDGNQYYWREQTLSWELVTE